MRILGAFLIGTVILIAAGERIKKETKSVLALEELTRFIERIRLEIGCYLKPINKIPRDFSSKYLSDIGFLERAERDGLETAWENVEEKLCMRDEEKILFKRLFSVLGKGYAEDEMRLLDENAAKLRELVEKRRGECPSKKKLTVTLSTALALGIIILLI